MRKLKEALLFIIITVITLIIIYAFPLYKLCNITCFDASFIAYDSDVTEYQNTLMDFITADDISNQVKSTVSELLMEDYKIAKQGIEDSLTISVYYVCIISLLILLIGIYIFKNNKKAKAIGISLMTSGIISVVACICLSYGIYIRYLV